MELGDGLILGIFQDAANAIHAKYIKDETQNNPVQLAFADMKHRSIVVMLDPDQVKNSKAIMGGSTVALDANTLQSVEPTRDVPVEIQYGKMKPLSCSSINATCRPLIGGISIGEQNTRTLNTLGYKATRLTVPGFVMAGHSAIGNGHVIVQPFNVAANRVGSVIQSLQIPQCDCAFVATDAGVNVDYTAFKASGQVYTLTGKDPRSSQVAGAFVLKAGARTGVTLGQITSNIPQNYDVLMQIYNGGGDSGAIVFSYTTTGTNNHLYGLLWSGVDPPSYNYARYYTWDQIQNQIGASPP